MVIYVKNMKYIYILLCAILPGTVLAQSSVDSILNSVAQNNLELKALAAQNKAAVYDLKSENVLKGPTVEYSPFYTRGYRGVASSELVVSEEFDFPTQYVQRHRQAKLEGQALEGAYQVRRREILLEALQLCYDIIGQNQRIALWRERLDQSTSIAQLYQKRMDAGDANALELNKALLERVQVSQVLVQEENQLHLFLQQLQALNGNQPVVINDQIFPEHDELDTQYSLTLPEVEGAERALQASQHEVSMARQSWLPSLTVGYRRNTEEGTNLNGFIVGMSLPLLSTSGKVKAAKQRRLSAELQLEQTRQEVANAQRTRYEQLQHLRRVMDHSDVNLIRETLPLLEKALQHGQINALQYYNEYNDLYDKLLAHIAVHCQYLKLYSELYYH